MELMTGILVAAIVVFALVLLGRLLKKVWKAEAAHAKHLKDDRKAREGDHPD
jgi:H+/gluconate symporter-like permease